MKRFLLFAGHHYYPEGGMDDLIDSYDTVEEAEAKSLVCAGYDKNKTFDREWHWFHIYDLELKKIIIQSHDND